MNYPTNFATCFCGSLLMENTEYKGRKLLDLDYSYEDFSILRGKFHYKFLFYHP